MSIIQIEAELKSISAEELRRLAVSSWAAFVEKEASDPALNECDENNPELLAALNDAVRQADGHGRRSVAGSEVRSRIRAWTTR
jgi:hypothetical protein